MRQSVRKIFQYSIAVVVIALATAFGITGCGSSATTGVDGAKIFVSSGCAGCHTLAAANASAKIGVNLDELKPNQARVAAKLSKPGVAMPSFKDKLSPEQIAAVSAYVATSSGSE